MQGPTRTFLKVLVVFFISLLLPGGPTRLGVKGNTLLVSDAWAQPAKDAITPPAGSFPFLGEVKGVKDVNIRAGQSVSFEKIGQLADKDTVVILDRQFDWYKIKLPVGADSYVSEKFVRPAAINVGEVTGDRVNIRARPNATAAILGQLAKGTLVRVTGQDQGWLKIEPPESAHGWVAAQFLVFKSKEVPPVRVVKIEAAPPAALAVPTPVPDTRAVVKAQGVVVDLGPKTLSSDIRHKIVLDDKKSYYLQGYRKIVDGFLNSRVNVEGRVLPDAKADQPVVLVTKIKWVL